MGKDIVFGAGEYAPGAPAGRGLLAHELAHTLQQGRALSAGPLSVSQPGDALEQQADTMARSALQGRPMPSPTRASAHVARQTKGAPDTQASEAAPQDRLAGRRVEEIIISLARRRVGFRVPPHMILGHVDTDLKPGRYTLKVDLVKRQWNIVAPATKTGLRFSVTLEGADPWNLGYPQEIPLLVVEGLATEPKTWGDAVDSEGGQKDPLWLYEGMPSNAAPSASGPDDFDAVRYDLDYHSEHGHLSKWLTVSYPDGSRVDIHLDSITPKTPRLWAAKQEAIRVMEEYNALFYLGTFPTVFFIITISPLATSPKGPSRGGGFRATRRIVPRSGGTGEAPLGEHETRAPKQEAAPENQGVTPPKQESTTRNVPERPKEPAIEQGKEPQQSAAVARKLIKPLNGTVNVGGGHEPGSEAATNLNPLKPGSGGPTKGIPNHVEAGFENIGEIFEPGSVNKVISNRLRYVDVNWPAAARGTAKVMAKGGRLSLNVWNSGPKEAQAVVQAFRNAGFKGVRAIGEGSATIIEGEL